MQEQLCNNIIDTLIEQGVVDFCICAGSRNQLIVEALKNKKVSSYNFVDEQGAGFFSLGRAKATGNPTAIVTTSGTAVAQLLPAIIEAFYSGVSIVLISADRPKEYRGSGAPQSIEQKNIFNEYVSNCYDLDSCSMGSGQLKKSIRIEKNKPLHINVCLDDEKNKKIDLKNVKKDYKPVEAEKIYSANPVEFFKTNKNPLVVVGGLKSIKDQQSVTQILLNLNQPCYLEPLSGLRGIEPLKEIEFFGLEKSLSQFDFDSVIRIGDIPTFRYWRDLESGQKDVMVVNDLPFSGLSKLKTKPTPIAEFVSFLQEQEKFIETQLQSNKRDQPGIFKRAKYDICALSSLLEKNQLSEVAAMKNLLEKMPKDASLFLGNSLPIRTADIASKLCELPSLVFANRGANGIDGLVSSFLGVCHPDKENWLILGDLSFLYDLNGLWPLKKYLSEFNIKIVIINNKGGQIFSRVMKKKPKLFKSFFENSHELDFKAIADFWGLSYLKTQDAKELKVLPRQTLIEVITDSEQSQSFWFDYDNL